MGVTIDYSSVLSCVQLPLSSPCKGPLTPLVDSTECLWQTFATKDNDPFLASNSSSGPVRIVSKNYFT